MCYLSRSASFRDLKCYASLRQDTGRKEVLRIPMIITIRVSDLDGALIKRYAHFNNETVSTLLKRLIMDQIEDDYRKLIAQLEEVKPS